MFIQGDGAQYLEIPHQAAQERRVCKTAIMEDNHSFEQKIRENKIFIIVRHTYPLEFLLYMTWSMTVVYYKVIYLPVGIRIWFWPNCQIRVFGDMANFSSEIG